MGGKDRSYMIGYVIGMLLALIIIPIVTLLVMLLQIRILHGLMTIFRWILFK